MDVVVGGVSLHIIIIRYAAWISPGLPVLILRHVTVHSDSMLA